MPAFFYEMNLLQTDTKRNRIAEGVFLSGIIVFAIGLPLSVFLMSCGQLIALIGWCIYPDYLKRIGQFFNNKIALSFVLIYAMHLIGMLWTKDINAGLKDLRIKFPLFILPFMFGSVTPFNRRQFHLVLYFFLAAVLLSTIISTAVWLGFTKKQITDIRQISLFISHIRLGLFVIMAIFICMYFIFFTSLKMLYKILFFALTGWLICFLIILEAVTAMLVFAIIISVYGFFIFIKDKKYAFTGALLIAIACALFYFGNFGLKMYRSMTIANPVNVEQLDKKTKYGHDYFHHFDAKYLENGNCNSVYFCFDEMQQAWPKRSSMDITGKDKKGNKLHLTLTRYLTSKGLRKDYDGVMTLTDADVRNVENGIPSINRVQYGKLRGRIYEIVWELNNTRNTGEASGSSLSQRFLYWKASLAIINSNKLNGVGTGDNQNEFNAYYDSVKSNLTKEWRLRSHNQYLAIGVSFGITGLLIFMLLLFYPISIKKFRNDFLYLTFFVAMILSFINEDTMETQAGISFVMFFSCMYLFRNGEADQRDY